MTIAAAPTPQSLTTRFWAKVDMTAGLFGCWEWTAFRHKGWGRFQVATTTSVGAHRIAYELAIWPIPEGFEVDHLCFNRGCVNPAHLEAVSGAENKRRANAHRNPNREKTVCRNGHPFDASNTYVWRGERQCRVCLRANKLAMRQRRLAA